MYKMFRFLVFGIFFLFPACNSSSLIENSEKIIHNAHLGNGWYLQDQEVLNNKLEEFFSFSKNNFDVVVDPNSIKVLIAPHAGYYYSGIAAASAYQNLLEDKNSFTKNKKIKKVIILSPSHVKGFRGISLPDYNIYKTALGDIDVDAESINILKEQENFDVILGTHDTEHAIEVQLPFLQKTIQDFEIVPLVVGYLALNDYDSVVASLEKIIDDSTLIVISSDFIHYGSDFNFAPFAKNIFYKIRQVDGMAIRAISEKSFDGFADMIQKTNATICGQNPIKIVLKLLQKNVLGDLQTRICSYYTSPQILEMYKKGETEKGELLLKNINDDLAKNSVSYLGLVFTDQKLQDLKQEDQLTGFEKKALLISARDTLQNSFKDKSEKIEEHLLWPIPSLGVMEKKGAFVTLNTKDGNLQGCIGRIVAREPLFATVQRMTKSAAFEDTRFSPLKENELNNIVIDISVLTPPKKVSSYKDIEIGKHGVILKKFLPNRGYVSSVFLPQVPPSFGWNLERTLEQLSLKAGLDKDAWKQDCEFEVFEGFEISEEFMKKDKKYKNIIFDLGAVLVNWQPQKFVKDFKTKNNLALDDDCLLKIFKNPIYKNLDKGLLTRVDVLQACSSELDKLFLTYVFENFKDHLYPLDQGLKIFEIIKNKNFKTYVLSNFSKEGFEELLPSYDFLDKFDGAVISYKEKQIKPELEIYKTLIEKYNLIPEECLFIDDMPENISAAKKCGIDGIVCKNHDFVMDELKKLKII